MSGRSRSKQQTNSLVALGSAAVLAIYSAGFVRTRAAAQRFDDEGMARRAPNEPIVRSAVPPEVAAAPQATGATAVTTPSALETTTVASTNARVTSALSKREMDPPAVTSPQVAVVRSGAAETTAAVPDSVPTAVAPAPTPAPAAAPAVPAVAPKDSSSKPEEKAVAWKDGVYFGWGTSRHGDIQAEVEIRGGRIVSAAISQCLTRYSCSWIAALPPQVLTRQSPDVDYVSGATQSANAFYYAVVDALIKAK